MEQNWYTNAGATDYITSDIKNLSLRSDYHGNEKVAVGNCVGLRISRFGSNYVQTPFVPFCLNNMLYVPNTSTNRTVLRMIIIAILYLNPLVFVSRTRLRG